MNKLYKTISVLLLFVLVFASTCFFVVAAPENETSDKKVEEKETSDKKNDSEQKKSYEKPTLGEGETGILIDATGGYVVFEKDSNKRMYPASTTKIMTALLAFEAIDRGEITLDTQIEIIKEMLDGLDPDGSSMDLKEGETVSLDGLLKGLLIPSGNDAACAIAHKLGEGNIRNFVDRMNSRAKELGAENTNFENPNGLHNENHYSTAADLAKISREAMKHHGFRNIVDCAHIKIPPTNKTEKERYYINTNGLISAMRYGGYVYKGATGIKTGNTQNAGNCLVASAKRDGIEFIGVILGGKTIADSHGDNIKMLDWAFDNYTSATSAVKGNIYSEIKVRQAKGTDSVTLAASETVTVPVPKGTSPDSVELKANIPDSVRAPINAGDEIGTLSVMLNGTEIGSCKLLATTSVSRSFFWPVMALGDILWGNMITRVIIYLLGIGIILFIIVFIYKIIKNLKAEKRYRQRKSQNNRKK